MKNMDLFESVFGRKENMDRIWTDKDLKRIFSFKNPSGLSKDEIMLMMSAAVFVQNNITPETYTKIYDIAKKNPVVSLLPLDLIFNSRGDDPDAFEDDDFEDDDWVDDDYEMPGLSGFPLRDADKKSLVLKIQLRGVSKPPLWREVQVPANINFLQLHQIIQALFGWGDYHLWEFEERPYSHGYRIGMPSSEDSQWDDGPTDNADETPVTTVLKNKGDKMVYVYDFGDDWIHDISVKEVLDKKTEHPVCLKFKGGNPVEDIGGPWGLADYREEHGLPDFDINEVNVLLAEV